MTLQPTGATGAEGIAVGFALLPLSQDGSSLLLNRVTFLCERFDS